MAAAYTTVSRGWQPYMEQHTFRNIRLDQYRIEEAWRIVTTFRREYVCEVWMDIILPKHERKPMPPHHETADEQAENSQIFTDAIMSLFEMLASWASSAAERRGPQARICLRLRAYSTTDLSSENSKDWLLKVNPDSSYRWIKSDLSLSNIIPLELPAIPIISDLYFNESRHQRAISPSTCCEITSRFSNIHSLKWWFRDGEMYTIERRKEMRQRLAAGIASLPPSVRSFTLFHQGDNPFDFIDWIPTNLCPDGSRLDPLSLSIAQLLPQLEFLRLDGVIISTEALWPSSQPDKVVNFPRLRALYIDMNVVSPSGEWLLRRNDYGFRNVIVPELVNPYFLAAARAAVHMPRLRRFSVAIKKTAQMTYLVSDEEQKTTLTFVGVPPFEWSDEVRDAWREATRARMGVSEAMELRRVRPEYLEIPWDYEPDPTRCFEL